jgi:hypothetical protein
MVAGKRSPLRPTTVATAAMGQTQPVTALLIPDVRALSADSPVFPAATVPAGVTRAGREGSHPPTLGVSGAGGEG